MLRSPRGSNGHMCVPLRRGMLEHSRVHPSVAHCIAANVRAMWLRGELPIWARLRWRCLWRSAEHLVQTNRNELVDW